MNKPSVLRAGAAETIITTAAGMPLVIRPSVGVHDELYARALVLDDGRNAAALVTLDLTGLAFSFSDVLRRQMEERSGIKAVLLNCTHTHSSPFTIPYSVTNDRWLATQGHAWQEMLKERITQAVCQAKESLAPASVRIGRGAARIGRNRNAELYAQPQQQMDAAIPWVDVLRVDDANDRPIAILFSYAAHPVVVHHASDMITADYPGFATEQVKRHFGGHTIAMFAQACGGDINGEPLNNGLSAAQAAGTALAQGVIEAAQASEPLTPEKIALFSSTFELPLVDTPTREQCLAHLAQMEKDRAAANPADMNSEAEWWYRDTVLCLQDRIGQIERGEKNALRFDINVLTLNRQWCLVTMTHEVFSTYQLWLEKNSPFPHNMVWGYTTACESYIPQDRDLGGRGPESALFGAPLYYHHRTAPQVGMEEKIKKELTALLTRAFSA